MEMTHRYYDFCLPYKDNHDAMINLMEEFLKTDYKTVAIEQVFIYDTSEMSMVRGAEVFPEPADITYLQEKYKLQLKLISRLTIVFWDANISATMNASLNLKKYKLIAGLPLSEPALKYCCSEFNGDLITFVPSRGDLIYVAHRYLKIALQREMFFELQYSLTLVDKDAFQECIRVAHSLRVRGKLRNTIISSGANAPFDLRAPYDVHNLSFIFGMTKEEGKAAIDRNCRLLFMRANARRIGKTFGFVRVNNEIDYSDTTDDEDPEAEEALTIVRSVRNFNPSNDEVTEVENVKNASEADSEPEPDSEPGEKSSSVDLNDIPQPAEQQNIPQNDSESSEEEEFEEVDNVEPQAKKPCHSHD